MPASKSTTELTKDDIIVAFKILAVEQRYGQRKRDTKQKGKKSREKGCLL